MFEFEPYISARLLDIQSKAAEYFQDLNAGIHAVQDTNATAPSSTAPQLFQKLVSVYLSSSMYARRPSARVSHSQPLVGCKLSSAATIYVLCHMGWM